MAVDWLAIKTEYVNNADSSYRKLSQQFGVSVTSIGKKAKEEDWVGHRERQLHNISTEVAQRTVEKTAEALSDEAASKARIRASIMRIAEGWFERQEKYIADGLEIDPGDFRRMVQSYKDLCDTGNPAEDENRAGGVVELFAADPEPTPPDYIVEAADHE